MSRRHVSSCSSFSLFLVLVKKVVAFVEVVMVLEGKRRRRFGAAKKFDSSKKMKETRRKKTYLFLWTHIVEDIS